MGWDEALDFGASKLARTKQQSGAASIVHWRRAGSLGLLKHLSDYFFSLFGPQGHPMREAPPPAARTSNEYPLFLLAMSTRKSQCSQWANAPELPLRLSVHPWAAAGLRDGELGEIKSVIGRMPVRIELDPAQHPDVALLPKGGPRAASACANVLIHAQATDLGEGAALYEECVHSVPRTRLSSNPERRTD